MGYLFNYLLIGMREIFIFNGTVLIQTEHGIARRGFQVITGAGRFLIAFAPPKTAHGPVTAI